MKVTAATLTIFMSLGLGSLPSEEDPWANPLPETPPLTPALQPEPHDEIQDLHQGFFTTEELGKILGKPLRKSESQHYCIFSMLPETDNKAILDHTEKAVLELGRLLLDHDIFATVPERPILLVLDSHKAYEAYVKTLLETKFFNAVQADLLLRGTGFGFRSKEMSLEILELDPTKPQLHKCGSVAHRIITNLLEAWKNPGKNSKPLPTWFKIGTVLHIDMSLSGCGSFYEIAYGKTYALHEYLDHSSRRDWLRIYKNTKNPAPLLKVINTSFGAFTHECRAISWMACETLLKHEKKTVFAELVEKFRTASDYETCFMEVTGWDYIRFASQMKEWVNTQMIDIDSTGKR